MSRPSTMRGACGLFHHPLWELAIVTPHYAGGGPIHRRGAAEEVARNLRRFVRGQALLYEVNRADVPTD
jgi:phosphoglycerate dehydrogenase-like enzyme